MFCGSQNVSVSAKPISAECQTSETPSYPSPASQFHPTGTGGVRCWLGVAVACTSEGTAEPPPRACTSEGPAEPAPAPLPRPPDSQLEPPWLRIQEYSYVASLHYVGLQSLTLTAPLDESSPTNLVVATLPQVICLMGNRTTITCSQY